jgi:C4-dicarboxylate-specific signal transduction histidine kinase
MVIDPSRGQTPAKITRLTEHDIEQLLAERADLEQRVHRGDQRRRAMVHIMDDLNRANRKLADHRKATLHILQDAHQSNERLEKSRKAMIHIMGDLAETTSAIQRREAELREKQEQLVQAAKLATLGELTTGVAHELNNPLNNIGLFVGNAMDLIEMGAADSEAVLRELRLAMQQVRKATEIITHLRTFGRAAPASREAVAVNQVVERSLSLMHEQFRLRQIAVELSLDPSDPLVSANAIQLEQVFINLLTNARDALAQANPKVIMITTAVEKESVILTFRDTGSGIAEELEQRIFDPFFTTKEVGKGTGLGLSITYGIIRDHHGSISVESQPGRGASFQVTLPLCHSADNPTDSPMELVQ